MRPQGCVRSDFTLRRKDLCTFVKLKVEFYNFGQLVNLYVGNTYDILVDEEIFVCIIKTYNEFTYFASIYELISR